MFSSSSECERSYQKIPLLMHPFQVSAIALTLVLPFLPLTYLDSSVAIADQERYIVRFKLGCNHKPVYQCSKLG